MTFSGSNATIDISAAAEKAKGNEMYVITGTTHKGETFVLGYSANYSKAEKFAKEVSRDEYPYVDLQTASKI